MQSGITPVFEMMPLFLREIQTTIKINMEYWTILYVFWSKNFYFAWWTLQPILSWIFILDIFILSSFCMSDEKKIVSRGYLRIWYSRKVILLSIKDFIKCNIVFIGWFNGIYGNYNQSLVQWNLKDIRRSLTLYIWCLCRFWVFCFLYFFNNEIFH